MRNICINSTTHTHTMSGTDNKKIDTPKLRMYEKKILCGVIDCGTSSNYFCLFSFTPDRRREEEEESFACALFKVEEEEDEDESALERRRRSMKRKRRKITVCSQLATKLLVYARMLLRVIQLMYTNEENYSKAERSFVKQKRQRQREKECKG